jgi:hypothetical protein
MFDCGQDGERETMLDSARLLFSLVPNTMPTRTKLRKRKNTRKNNNTDDKSIKSKIFRLFDQQKCIRLKTREQRAKKKNGIRVELLLSFGFIQLYLSTKTARFGNRVEPGDGLSSLSLYFLCIMMKSTDQIAKRDDGSRQVAFHFGLLFQERMSTSNDKFEQL